MPSRWNKTTKFLLVVGVLSVWNSPAIADGHWNILPCSQQLVDARQSDFPPIMDFGQEVSYSTAFETAFGCSLQRTINDWSDDRNLALTFAGASLGQLENFYFNLDSLRAMAVFELDDWARAREMGDPNIDLLPRYAIAEVGDLILNESMATVSAGAFVGFIGADDPGLGSFLEPIPEDQTLQLVQLREAIAGGLGRNALVQIVFTSAPDGATIRVGNDFWGQTDRRLYGNLHQVPLVVMEYDGSVCEVEPDEDMYSQWQNALVIHCDFDR